MQDKPPQQTRGLQTYDFSWVKRPSYDGLTQQEIDGPIGELVAGLTQSNVTVNWIEQTEFAGLESLISAIHDKYGSADERTPVLPMLNLRPDSNVSSMSNPRYNAEAHKFFEHHGIMPLMKYNPNEHERYVLLAARTHRLNPRTEQVIPVTAIETEDLLQNVLIPYFDQHLVPVNERQRMGLDNIELTLFSMPVFKYMLDMVHGPHAREMCRQLLKDFDNEESALKAYYAMLKSAVERGATDIHIEPGSEIDEQGKPRIRYRIDGALTEVNSRLPQRVLSGLINVVKTGARLDISEKRRPQDGAIAFGQKAREQEIIEGITPKGSRVIGDPDLINYIVQQERALAGYSLRVSVIPVINGEKAVLRILKLDRDFHLNRLGYPERDLVKLGKGLDSPNGLFLVTGPTGSGKTTTLYAALREMNKTDVNISTVEDPVEIPLRGINQTQVNPTINLTFAELLRRLLRQDPDILLVGEIRDPETASVAIQASETGHLVLSTLHTNNAPSVVPRLFELGVQSTQLQNNLRCVAAQRLIRKICPKCRTKYNAREDIEDLFGKDFVHHDVLVYAENETSRNCEVCGGLGFHGRAPITEIWTPRDAERRLMFEGIKDSRKYEELAIAGGMTPLAVSGFERLLSGETSLRFLKEFVSEEDLLRSAKTIQELLLAHRGR
jgi:type II secretory ATPase GspE/PulE/Tfp pilus assembly ATPase PilB-like protein